MTMLRWLFTMVTFMTGFGVLAWAILFGSPVGHWPTVSEFAQAVALAFSFWAVALWAAPKD